MDLEEPHPAPVAAAAAYSEIVPLAEPADQAGAFNFVVSRPKHRGLAAGAQARSAKARSAVKAVAEARL